MKNQNKQIFSWILIFVLMMLTFNFLQGPGRSSAEELAFSDFLIKVDEKQVNEVKISGRDIEGTLTNGGSFYTYATSYPNLIDKLSSNGVRFEVVRPDTKMNSLLSILIAWFPMLLLIGVWVFFMRQMQGGGKGMGFGKSKAKMLSENAKKVTFADVAGIDEEKAELSELVDFLRNPGKFQKLGGNIPKGCLLVGPPGTGKTLLARAIAGEANVPFFSISGSDFVEMFVGVGASRVRDMFEQGKKNAPCLIFIDEIDAVGRKRGNGMGGGHDEREQTLNQMLVEMDGFEANEGVIIIAATNRPDVLDAALLRPGRFDRRVTISPPNLKGREEILKVHMKKVKFAEDVSAEYLARGTYGFTGAQLQNLVNEAALFAARNNKKIVDNEAFDQARDKIIMGSPKSYAMTEKEKKLTAYHEAGHALVSLYAPAHIPIHKATILPRGSALGAVHFLPKNDQVSKTLEQYESEIAVSMGGRAAEVIIFGEKQVTSGAAGDIQAATNIARSIVMRGGLSKKVGNVQYNYSDNDYGSPGVSQKTMEMIDSEVKRLIDEGHAYAIKTLEKNIDELHVLAKGLLEHEILTEKQIKHLLLGNDVNSKKEAVFPIGSKPAKKKTVKSVPHKDSGSDDTEIKAKSKPKKDSVVN